MYSHCLYGEPYKENSTGCHIVDERNERIELLEREVNSFKQSLNEIKEYINGMNHLEGWIDIDGYSKREKDILQIIDKALEEGL